MLKMTIVIYRNKGFKVTTPEDWKLWVNNYKVKDAIVDSARILEVSYSTFEYIMQNYFLSTVQQILNSYWSSADVYSCGNE